MEVSAINILFHYGKDSKTALDSTTALSFRIDEKNQLVADLPNKDATVILEKDPEGFINSMIKSWSTMLKYNSVEINFNVVYNDKKYDNMFCQVLTLDDIIAMRQNCEKIGMVGCDKDDDEDVIGCSYDWADDLVYEWAAREFFNEKVRMLVQLYNSYRKIAYFEGKECPVLLKPLGKDAVILKKCKHIISGAAWSKISWTKTESGYDNCRKCPLCRCEYENHSGWSSEYPEIIECLEGMD